MICLVRPRIREEERRSLSHSHLSFFLTIMLDMMNDDNQLKLFFYGGNHDIINLSLQNCPLVLSLFSADTLGLL